MIVFKEECMKKISNYGRWGKEDERGTLNLISDSTVLSALNLPNKGKVYSLGAKVGAKGPKAPKRNNSWHTVTVFDSENRSEADDLLVTHCHASTHIDALSHVWYDNELYNGHSSEHVGRFGADKCGIENVKWLIGRGILLDIPAAKGIDHLPQDYEITSEDLEFTLNHQKIQSYPGDIVLVRTGWFQQYGENTDNNLNNAFPGLVPSTSEWFAERDVCAVGSDNVAVEKYDINEDFYKGEFHKIMLRDLGTYLIEFLNLEELSADKAWEFLFVATPLRIEGGVGSPINPIAIV
jgi:kynurenine formamidase